MSMKHPHNWLHEKKLEQVPIAQRIVLQKNVIMTKGQQRKIKGEIHNVPVECDQTTSSST